MSERVIAVDCESSGLRTHLDIPVEVAWWDLGTGDKGVFIPRHDTSWVLRHGEPRALEVNGYRERIADQPQDDDTEAALLFHRLAGASLVGSNVRQDAAWLENMFALTPALYGLRTTPENPKPYEPWHHRLWDVSVMAAQEFGLPRLPGLWDVCQMLEVPPEGDVHTAFGGVMVTGLCYTLLSSMAIRRNRALAGVSVVR
jgi:hypothetical protein